MTGFFSNLFGSSALRIEEPTLGFYDLSHNKDTEIVVQDHKVLSPLFHQVVIGQDSPPGCDVLFLYCNLASNGRINGSQSSLGEIIRASGAVIAVVASPNNPEAYIAAAKGQTYRKVNLVMTLDRKGEAFRHFFCRLFAEMNNGVSMPSAWVTLASQQPGLEHIDCPETIFSCEAGKLRFG